MFKVGASVEDLFQLAKNRSVESRNELASIIKDLLEDKRSVISDREKNLMFKIMETLFHEVEQSIRTELSGYLADRDDVPIDLINYIANEEIEVSRQILARSELLCDEELVKIIHYRTAEYQMAITQRQFISEEVSDAIVEAGEDDVIVSLLNNPNSSISNITMEYLIEEAKRVDTFQEPLVHRKELNKELGSKLFLIVSDILRENIATKFSIPKDDVTKLLKEAQSSKKGDNGAPLPAAKELINQLKEKGMVNPHVMVSALNQGEISLFFGLFMELTKLDEEFAKAIVFDGNGEEIAVACKAIGVTELEFMKIFKKTRKKVGHSRVDTSQKYVNKMMTFFRTMNEENSIKALASWGNFKAGPSQKEEI